MSTNLIHAGRARRNVRSRAWLLLSLALLGASGSAQALHIDVVVGHSAGQLTTAFCAAGAQGCDSLPALQQLGLPLGVLPLDGVGGRQIFVTDFSDFDGGPFAVDDPGFFAGAGSLPGNLLLSYAASGSLRYFDAAAGDWLEATPNGERIRLFGGLATEIIADTSHCGGLLICIPQDIVNFVEGSTVFTSSGIQGASTLIVDNTRPDGTLHAHLDWFMEKADGTRGGAVGAYVLELRMTAPGFADSDPFLVLFNRGLGNGDFGLALDALMAVPPPPPPPPPNGDSNVNWPGGVLDVPFASQFSVASASPTATSPFNLLTLGLTGAGEIALGPHALVVDVATSAAFDGLIAGTGMLIKRGTGTQRLTGTALHTGGTRIEAGTLDVAAGTLTGDVVNHGELSFSLTQDETFAGLISGPGQVAKTGSGTLRLTGSNTYAGGTRVSGGLSIGSDANLGTVSAPLVLDTAVLHIENSITMQRPVHVTGDNVLDTGAATFGLNGPLSGSGVLRKQGTGDFALQGAHPFDGRLRVDQGLLRLRGTLAADVDIGAGATLVGNGDLGGDLAFAPGSRLRVQIAPDGQSDRLRVTAGRIDLDQAVLDIVATPGDYPLQSSYTLLQASGGVHGTFAEVGSNLAFLTPTLLYGAQDVTLQMVRNDLAFADLARSPTQLATARVLDAGTAVPGSDMARVVEAFTTLNLAEVPGVLEAIGGSALVGVPAAVSVQANTLTRQVASRLGASGLSGALPRFGMNTSEDILLASSDGPQGAAALYQAAFSAASALTSTPGQGVWLRGLAGVGDYDLAAGQQADADHAGVVLGYDGQLTPHLTLGLFGAYTDAELKQNAPSSETAIKGWQIGSYGRWRHDAFHVDGLFSYGRDDFSTNRRLVIGALQRRATADFDGYNVNVYGETGYTYDVGVVVQPYVALQWSQQSRDAYQESGAGALNLSVDAQDNDSVRSLFGVRLRHTLEAFDSGPVEVELRAAWAHEFADAAEFRARLAGDAAATLFTVRNSNALDNAANVGAGVIAQLHRHAFVFADLDGEVSGAHQAFSLSAGLRARW